jgi:hypothetical protein
VALEGRLHLAAELVYGSAVVSRVKQGKLGADLFGVGVVQVFEDGESTGPRVAGGGYIAAGVMSIACVGEGLGFLMVVAKVGV